MNELKKWEVVAVTLILFVLIIMTNIRIEILSQRLDKYYTYASSGQVDNFCDIVGIANYLGVKRIEQKVTPYTEWGKK